jgi:hypothetical protein
VSEATFAWKSYLPESRSGTDRFANSLAPLDDNYRPAPTADHELLDYVDLLKRQPINRAAHTVVTTTAEAESPTEAHIPAMSIRARHSAPAEPPTATSVALLDRPAPPPPPEPASHGTLADILDIEPAENDDYDLYEPVEGDDFIRDKKGRRVFEHLSPEGSGYIAVDHDNRPFTTPDGTYIYVNRRGVAEEDRSTLGGLLRKARNWTRSGGASSDELEDDTPQLYDENGAPVQFFEVPPAGSAPTISHRMLGRRRLTILAAVVIAFSTFTGLIGVTVGRSAVPSQGAVSVNEASAYRLSDLPVAAMAAFGQQYLQLCLTHGLQDQVTARSAILASMSTAGAGDDCGWTEGGKVQAPKMISYSGRWKPLEGFATGRAAVLDFNVTMDSLEFFTASVPMWVNSADTSNDMSVVGLIGLSPGLRNQKPEAYEAPMDQDPRLASELQADLLPAFFAAWAASDANQIALTAATDASQEVRTGLNGLFTNPTIGATQVFTPYNTSGGQTIVYSDGAEVEAVVTVGWELPSSQSTQTTGYRVGVRRTAGKWQIVSINGGAVTDRAADPNTKESSSTGINRVDAGLATTGGAATEEPTPAATPTTPPTTAAESSEAAP